jgi:acetyltransferase-like isoleucine patch superfamily enzyme
MHIFGEGRVTIGDNFHSGAGCEIITHIHNYDHGDAIPYDSTYLHKDVTIEDNVWLGRHVLIIGGVVIGEGAIIQAGSVVVGNIPACAIAGGHPARVFKQRDIGHYQRLKKEKKFH